jgi:hypothetical protein
MFQPIISKTGEQLAGLNIQIPNIQTAINEAVKTVNEQVPGIFAALQQEIEDLKESIGAEADDPKNPFRKVYQAAKKVAALIAAEFAKIPVKPGSGTGAKTGKPDTDDITDEEQDYIPPAAVVEKRKGLKTTVETFEVGKEKFRVTYYYDGIGRNLPELTRYERLLTPQEAGLRPKVDIDRLDIPVPREIPRDRLPDDAQRMYGPSRKDLPFVANQSFLIPSELKRQMLLDPIRRGLPPMQVNQNVIDALRAQSTGTPYLPSADILSRQADRRGLVASASQAPLEGFAKNLPNFPTVKDALASLTPGLQEEAKKQGNNLWLAIAQGLREGTIKYNKNDVRDAIIAFLKSPKAAESNSPAKIAIPIGGFIVQGIAKGMRDGFAAATSMSLNLTTWLRSSLGFQGLSSPSLAAMGNVIARAIGSEISSSFGKIMTVGLSSNVATWLRKSLGITETSVSQLIKSVGENIIAGVKDGMIQWLTKPNLEIWTSLRSWLDTAFGTTGSVPSTKTKTVGVLLSSGIKEGMQSWFTGPTAIGAGSQVWQGLETWINAAIGVNKKAGSNFSEKTMPMGEALTTGIARGTETISNAANTSFTKMSNQLQSAIATSLGLNVAKNGSIGIGDSSSVFYRIGVLIIDTIIKGINDQQASSRLTAAVNSKQERESGVPSGQIDNQKRYFGGIIRAMYGGKIGYKGSREQAPGMAMGGKMKKYAAGAFVPGTGITDSVPALLTPGEFVVRKSVAQAYGPMLQALNSQVYPEMNKFAMGGFAGDVGSMSRMASSKMFPSFKAVARSRSFPTMSGRTQSINVGSNAGTAARAAGGDALNVEYNYNVNVNAQTNASSDAIANAVVYKFRRMEARQVRGTRIG